MSLRAIILLLILACPLFADGAFYRQYWAEFDENISNHKDGRWRVNDPELALHENFGRRSEAFANGLVLLNAPENLFDLEKAELYLEMWGGHPHTANKRVSINGKKSTTFRTMASLMGIAFTPIQLSRLRRLIWSPASMPCNSPASGAMVFGAIL